MESSRILTRPPHRALPPAGARAVLQGRSTSLLLAGLLLAGLPTSCSAPDGGLEQPPAQPGTWSALELEVIGLEANRSLGGGRLLQLAASEEVEVRRRAVAALGRIPLALHGPEVTEALVEALEDDDPEVRVAAAHGLGQRGDAAGAPAILFRLTGGAEDSAAVRAALVEGGSRLPDAGLREAILYSLSDPAAVVRGAAVVAPHRWTEEVPGGPSLPEIEATLVQVTRNRPVQGGELLDVPGVDYEGADTEEAEVIWRALFTLQRLRSVRAREAFLTHARAARPVESRLFAIKGLANIAADEETHQQRDRLVLESALEDSDWRIVCEALRGLAYHADSGSMPALAPLARSRSHHVRRVFWESLAQFPPELAMRIDIAALLASTAEDRSLSVRAAAIVAGARLGLLGCAELSELARSSEVLLRSAAAEALADTDDPVRAGELLIELTRDPHPLPAGRATTSLGELALGEESTLEPAQRTALRAALVDLVTGPDLGVRLAAVQALAVDARPDDLPALLAAYETSKGDVGPEVRLAALRVAATIGGEEVTELLVTAQQDEDRYVARVARDLLGDLAPGRAAQPSDPGEPAGWVATLEPTGSGELLVELHTSRGMLLFELFPREAPLHVESFLRLADGGFYEDLSFHRVVADFVVQGGCERGDGNGSRTYFDGQSLPAEIGTRSYRRGSLGMPRNENLDSGGSQLFITHRPTPHLDGRYTIFGELRSGSSVLDSIERGDRILMVRRR